MDPSPPLIPTLLPMLRTPSLLVALACAALVGCEDVVVVDLGETAARLVVEGGVVHDRATQTVRLNTTSPYFDASVAAPVTGATVSISDDRGQSIDLAEREPGVYEGSGLDTEIGRTYTLDVEVEGERYRAVEPLRAVAPIDEIRVVYEDGQNSEAVEGAVAGYRVKVDFRDPPARGDSYRWQTLVDGRPVFPPELGFGTSLLADDELFNGLMVEDYSPNAAVAFLPGQTVVVRQSSLTPRAFSFYELFFLQLDEGGGPFDVPPAEVRGNVANLTDSSRPALGYFLVTDTAEASITVPPAP